MGAPLHQHEKILLAALKGGEKTLKQLVSDTGLIADSVTRAAYWLREKNLASVKETPYVYYELTNEGLWFFHAGFPERRLIKKIGSGLPVSELKSIREEEMVTNGLIVSPVKEDELISIGLPWAKRKGWITIKEGRVLLTPEGKHALTKEGTDELLLQRIGKNILHILSETPPNQKQTYDLSQRKYSEYYAEYSKEILPLEQRGFVKKIISKDLVVVLTEKGVREAAPLQKEPHQVIVSFAGEYNELTVGDIRSGLWRDKKYRAYDVEAPVERAYAAKKHLLRRMIDRIRNIFAEMGFEEASGPLVESSFWNFDALFQPQDHPARDLADTFHLSAPSAAALPDKALVARVKQAHENGWRYAWSAEAAKQPVLRTHTTAVSARRLAALKATQAKLFCVGRVFRNEATDYKHLAEFHQVEGIVAWEGATFSHLLGLLREFYAKLGFERIRFRPSYFPYTEPSLEIEAFFEEKQQWLELGGAGIFRPEVCYPLWGRYPVLAFGLSLERPAMLLGGIEDIRTFYRNDLNWIRDSRVLDGGSRV